MITKLHAASVARAEEYLCAADRRYTELALVGTPTIPVDTNALILLALVYALADLTTSVEGLNPAQ